MKMDYSVTRQLSSKIPDKASTQQIKAGLERIKKAQQQVLQQLKRNHPDYSIDVRATNSQALHQRRIQNQNLKHQLDIQREKSTEKSTLYRRRVVDLQASLTAHQRNQERLHMEIKELQAQLRDWTQKYGDLQRDYEKLVNQSQASTRNVRNLEKQVMELVTKLKSDDTIRLKTQLEGINIQRNTIMSQKVYLLKTNSKLQSQNIQLKHQLSTLANRLTSPQYKSSSQSQQQQNNSLPSQSISYFLNQIHRMNSCHQLIFTTLKSNTKLSRTLIDKQNAYQNSLNKILEMLVHVQRGESVQGGVLQYRFDHQNMYREELHRVENQLTKKFKKQVLKLNMEKDQLNSKHKLKDKKIQQITQQKQQSQQKISQLRKQKSQLLSQLASLTSQLSNQKSQAQQQQKQKLQQLLNQQKSKDKQYNQIINEVNQQMVTIQKQKKDLQLLINKMTTNKNKSEDDDNRNKKQLSKIMEINTKIQDQNQKMQSKYQTILVQKQNLFITLSALQTKFDIQNRQIAKQVLQKQKLISELNRLKQQYDLNLIENKKYKLLSQTTKTQCQQINNSYLLQIERLIHDGLQLRQQIQILNRDRTELRDLKGKYGLLVKDNQILGKKARNLNGQVDHLWMIKEIQYQNVHKIITELKPL